jgi:hypothetical protein
LEEGLVSGARRRRGGDDADEVTVLRLSAREINHMAEEAAERGSKDVQDAKRPL